MNLTELSLTVLIRSKSSGTPWYHADSLHIIGQNSASPVDSGVNM